MSNENNLTYALLPTYLVLDTSASMTLGNAFGAAFDFLPQLLDEIDKNAAIADKLRVEVITFDDGAHSVFPLGTSQALATWLKEKKQSPIIPDGDRTNYGDAFRCLRQQIEKGVAQIRSDTYNGNPYKAYRPAVFFITDGAPNDDAGSRDKAFRELTDPSFYSRPNIICVGVGSAKPEDLAEYGAGRYGSDTYTVGNRKLVLVAKDGVAPSAALRTIIPALVSSIVSSINNHGDSPNNDPDDIVGNLPLFEDEEEFEDLFEVMDNE